jgi:hypothetical protein
MAECSTVTVQVDVVNAEPADTFLERLLACAAGQQPPNLRIRSPCGTLGEQMVHESHHSPSEAGEQLQSHHVPSQSPVRLDREGGQSQSQPTAGEATRYNMIYVSQITYLTQQTLLPDVGEAVRKLWSTCAGADGKVCRLVICIHHGHPCLGRVI